MAKSIRSKIKKRFRTAKRQRVSEMIDKPRSIACNRICAKIADGLPFEKKKSRNGFLYPNHKDAKIPQVCVVKPVDFRSSHLPMAGYAFKGNRRKYNEEEKVALVAQSRVHPKMQRLAGAPLPDVFRSEEELAAEQGGQSTDSGSCSPAMAVEETPAAGVPPAPGKLAEEKMEEEEDEEEDEQSPPLPEDGVDTSRKPVKKDLRKAQQAPKKKETLNIKKKNKQHQQQQRKNAASAAAVVGNPKK